MTATKLASVTCACGCGRSFRPTRRGQKFLNAKHRSDFHNARMRVLIAAARALQAGNR